MDGAGNQAGDGRASASELGSVPASNMDSHMELQNPSLLWVGGTTQCHPAVDRDTFPCGRLLQTLSSQPGMGPPSALGTLCRCTLNHFTPFSGDCFI